MKLKESYKKFKQDLLPKAYYDTIKGVFLLIMAFVFYKLFNQELKINELLDEAISLKIYWIIIIFLSFVIATIFVFKISFKKRMEELKKVTFTDEKTGLKSHRLLEEYLQNKIKESQKSGKALSIILIDIDNFKIFNETYTPTIGDRILSEVGKLLLDDVRITDQTFRRYETGDEFVVVSTDTNITQAKIPAERKREFIANHNFLIDDIVYKITVCCGIAQFKDTDNVKTLLDRANYAMRNIAKKKPKKNSTEHTS